jgi:hypothetical protein
MKFAGALSFFLVVLISCKITQLSNLSEQIQTKGFLADMTGLDGCGWMIKIPGIKGKAELKLQPVNLNEFDIKLVEGLPVLLNYKYEPGASVCMAGELITVISIEEYKK